MKIQVPVVDSEWTKNLFRTYLPVPVARALGSVADPGCFIPDP
jgi:hypothetical protein